MKNENLTFGIYEKAVAKIDTELKAFKGGNKETAVKQYVADTVKEFCHQEVEFSEAVIQNDKTLSDCCAEIMKGVGSHVSDIDVYRKAARFYFPGCSVRMTMTIDLIGENHENVKTGSVSVPAVPKKLDISLDDLLLPLRKDM